MFYGCIVCVCVCPNIQTQNVTIYKVKFDIIIFHEWKCECAHIKWSVDKLEMESEKCSNFDARFCVWISILAIICTTHCSNSTYSSFSLGLAFICVVITVNCLFATLTVPFSRHTVWYTCAARHLCKMSLVYTRHYTTSNPEATESDIG